VGARVTSGGEVGGDWNIGGTLLRMRRKSWTTIDMSWGRESVVFCRALEGEGKERFQCLGLLPLPLLGSFQR